MYNNWDYPMGADTPDAPWNEKDPPEKLFGITVSCGLSKDVDVTFTDYDFDENVLRFTNLNDTVEFIKVYADFISKSVLVNDYKKKYGKVVLYPSKVVPMYNTHKAISI